MANTQTKNKKIKNAVKFCLAVFILFSLWVFFNDSTYNLIKKQFVKNSDKYTEMYAYSKSRPSFLDKYFIVQGNAVAESFFKKEVNIVNGDDLSSIKCSNEEIVLLYEKPDTKISDFIKKMKGEELTLNKGTNIEFYVGKIKSLGKSCNIGG